MVLFKLKFNYLSKKNKLLDTYFSSRLYYD